MVRLDGFPGRGEFPVVHKGPALIVKTPQLTGDKLTVARKESRRSGRLVLVKVRILDRLQDYAWH